MSHRSTPGAIPLALTQLVSLTIFFKTLWASNTLSNVSNGVVSDSNAASTTVGQVNITKNVSVTGTITASGAIYSSDRNLKEHIVDIPEQDIDKVGFVSYKTYNFKGEDNKMYGIIAQDLQEVGLGELVYSKEDGTLAVDYTSLMILQLARLKRDNEYMLNVQLYSLGSGRNEVKTVLSMLDMLIRDAAVLGRDKNAELIGCSPENARALSGRITPYQAVRIHNKIELANKAIDSNVTIPLAMAALAAEIIEIL